VSERERQGGTEETGVCHICGEAFDTQEALSKHLLDEHGGDALTAEGPSAPGES
jgi:hypothetical protein